MTIHKTGYDKKLKTARFLAGILLLICGCLIYATWRSRDTNLCRWADGVGLGFVVDFLHYAIGRTDPGDFVIYNLPDGLYCVAYIFIMYFIWADHPVFIRALIASLIPMAAVAHETAQYLGLAPGTFDPLDLLCYALPYAIYLTALLTTASNPGKRRSRIDFTE